VSQDARKRLKALEEFSHLGGGLFQIAMKALGDPRRGKLCSRRAAVRANIAAVGYDMYCQMLRSGRRSRACRASPVLVHVVEVDRSTMGGALSASFLHALEDFLPRPAPAVGAAAARSWDEGPSTDEPMQAAAARVEDRYGQTARARVDAAAAVSSGSNTACSQGLSVCCRFCVI
jgi:hypothetical protein